MLMVESGVAGEPKHGLGDRGMGQAMPLRDITSLSIRQAMVPTAVSCREDTMAPSRSLI